LPAWVRPFPKRPNSRSGYAGAGGQKNGRPEGAAKFREETPRKGGGFVTRDHNAALQQYAKFVAGWQAQNTLFQTFLRGNRAKIRQCA
jgi:hypothetical protein